MKTTQDLQKEIKALQLQVAKQQAVEELARLKKQAVEEEESKKEFEGLVPKVKEIALRMRASRLLEEKLLKELKLESLRKNNGDFRIKVERVTTKEQRENIIKMKKTYVNYHVRDITTLAQQDIMRAKEEFRYDFYVEKRKLNYRPMSKIKEIMRKIKNVGKWYRGDNITTKEEIIKYFKRFMSEEKAIIKMNDLVRPYIVKEVEYDLKQNKRYTLLNEKRIADYKKELEEYKEEKIELEKILKENK